MGADDISKLVEFADSLVYEKTRHHLETVQKDILRQILLGKKLNQITSPSYEDSYVQRVLTPQLWKLLSYVVGEKVGKKTVGEVLKRLRSQQEQPSDPPQIQLQRLAAALGTKMKIYDWLERVQPALSIGNY